MAESAVPTEFEAPTKLTCIACSEECAFEDMASTWNKGKHYYGRCKSCAASERKWFRALKLANPEEAANIKTAFDPDSRRQFMQLHKDVGGKKLLKHMQVYYEQTVRKTKVAKANTDEALYSDVELQEKFAKDPEAYANVKKNASSVWCPVREQYLFALPSRSVTTTESEAVETVTTLSGEVTEALPAQPKSSGSASSSGGPQLALQGPAAKRQKLTKDEVERQMDEESVKLQLAHDALTAQLDVEPSILKKLPGGLVTRVNLALAQAASFLADYQVLKTADKGTKGDLAKLNKLLLDVQDYRPVLETHSKRLAGILEVFSDSSKAPAV
jgi:hypothetical protein